MRHKLRDLLIANVFAVTATTGQGQAQAQSQVLFSTQSCQEFSLGNAYWLCAPTHTELTPPAATATTSAFLASLPFFTEIRAEFMCSTAGTAAASFSTAGDTAVQQLVASAQGSVQTLRFVNTLLPRPIEVSAGTDASDTFVMAPCTLRLDRLETLPSVEPLQWYAASLAASVQDKLTWRTVLGAVNEMPAKFAYLSTLPATIKARREAAAMQLFYDRSELESLRATAIQRTLTDLEAARRDALQGAGGLLEVEEATVADLVHLQERVNEALALTAPCTQPGAGTQSSCLAAVDTVASQIGAMFEKDKLDLVVLQQFLSGEAERLQTSAPQLSARLRMLAQ